MGDLTSTCKDKQAYFRIKELKDVLTHLALPKHGKKQELVEHECCLKYDMQYLPVGSSSECLMQVVWFICRGPLHGPFIHVIPSIGNVSFDPPLKL